jgi:hypothetical protein
MEKGAKGPQNAQASNAAPVNPQETTREDPVFQSSRPARAAPIISSERTIAASDKGEDSFPAPESSTGGIEDSSRDPADEPSKASHQADNTGSRPDSKLEPFEYEPVEYVLFQEGDPEYGSYHARVVFECAPCREDLKYSDETLDGASWEFSEEDQPRIKLDGTESRKKHRHSGYHLVKGSPQRLSAAEKYLLWRTRTLRQASKEDARKPCAVTLLEYEPCGQQSEPGYCAEKIKALRQIFRVLARGSHITVVLSCTANPSLVKGRYTQWYQAILDLVNDWPSQVTIRIDDDSILAVDPRDYFPKEPEYRDLVREKHAAELADADPEDIDGLLALFEDTEKENHQTRCHNVTHNIDFCREFIHTIRKIQGEVTESTLSALEAQAGSAEDDQAGDEASTETSAWAVATEVPKRKLTGDYEGEDEDISSDRKGKRPMR